MKDNIREELETKYLKKELVNDNTLLLYEEVEDKVLVKMRFIKNNKINEYYVARLTKEEFFLGDSIRFNEDNTALAVFKRKKDKDILINFYDLEDHETVNADFLDCAYNLKFNNKVRDDFTLIKK